MVTLFSKWRTAPASFSSSAPQRRLPRHGSAAQNLGFPPGLGPRSWAKRGDSSGNHIADAMSYSEAWRWYHLYWGVIAGPPQEVEKESDDSRISKSSGRVVANSNLRTAPQNRPKETAYTERSEILRENLRARVSKPMVTGRAPKSPGWSVGVHGEPRGPSPVPSPQLPCEFGTKVFRYIPHPAPRKETEKRDFL